jgi:hypothetical protein
MHTYLGHENAKLSIVGAWLSDGVLI